MHSTRGLVVREKGNLRVIKATTYNVGAREKWKFALILLAMVLSIYTKNLLFLCLIMLGYTPHTATITTSSQSIELVSTHVSVEEKWNTSTHPKMFQTLFQSIDEAIASH